MSSIVGNLNLVLVIALSTAWLHELVTPWQTLGEGGGRFSRDARVFFSKSPVVAMGFNNNPIHNSQIILSHLGGLEHQFYFPINIGFLIIPIDELIFFRGVALAHQPVSDIPRYSQIIHPDIPRISGMIFVSRRCFPCLDRAPLANNPHITG